MTKAWASFIHSFSSMLAMPRDDIKCIYILIDLFAARSWNLFHLKKFDIESCNMINLFANHGRALPVPNHKMRKNSIVYNRPHKNH